MVDAAAAATGSVRALATVSVAGTDDTVVGKHE